jgi:hypothetical protein
MHAVGQQSTVETLTTVAMATDKHATMGATSLHATVEGTVVFYGVCSEATTANATELVSE